MPKTTTKEVKKTKPTIQSLRSKNKRLATGEALSQREYQVAILATSGKTNQEVADQLRVGKKTIDTHLQSVYKKLGVTNKIAMMQIVLKEDVRVKYTKTKEPHKNTKTHGTNT